MIATILIFVVRLAGLAALIAGAAYWSGVAIPLHAHMGLGGLVVLALWGLSFMAAARARGMAVLAGTWGAVVPLLGMMQIHVHLGDAHWLLQLAHVASGVIAIGLSEGLYRRLR